MARHRVSRVLVFLMFVVLPLTTIFGTSAAPPANAAFDRTWSRTDLPVANLLVNRTWMWGPEANTVALDEPYAEAPGGNRTVQYFDKSRMEDNSYRATAPWDVTNGLLVVELMTGQMQVGDNAFVTRAPAQENVAGDANDPTGPTYVTFAGLRSTAPYANGSTITQRVNRAGTITNDPTLAGQGVTAAYHVTVPGIDHQVASPFWTFMNSTGLVEQDGTTTTDELFENPFYATGYPVTEAYWANVAVAGVYRDVLMQCFERRCLTYTPGNPDGWQVEAGNVGQHYYRWRYSEAAQQSIAIASASTIVTTTSPTFVNVPNMSTSVATSATGDLAITFSGEGDTTSGGPGLIRAIVDGANAEPDVAVMFTGVFASTHAFTFAVHGVLEGTHTVQLQWMVAPGNTLRLARRSLVVQATPINSDYGSMTVVSAPPGPAQMIISTSYVPISGMSASIQTGAGADLSVTFSAEAFVSGGTGQMYVQAMIDGAAARPAEVIFAKGDLDGTRTFTFTAADVSGGTHTLQLYGKVDAGNTGVIVRRSLFVLASPPVAARGALAVATPTGGAIVATTSTDWVAIPGLSTTIDTPNDSLIAVTVSAEAATTAGGLGDVRVLVDGTPARPSDALLTSRTLDSYRGTESFTFVLDHLGAGSHTVVVQARVNAGQTFALYRRSMSVVAWPRQ